VNRRLSEHETNRVSDFDVDSLGDEQLKYVDVTSSGGNVDCRVSVLQSHSIHTWTILSTTRADGPSLTTACSTSSSFFSATWF